jgi:hypothetical protein
MVISCFDVPEERGFYGDAKRGLPICFKSVVINAACQVSLPRTWEVVVVHVHAHEFAEIPRL